MLQRVCVVVLGGTLAFTMFVVARCWVLRGRWSLCGCGFSVAPRGLPVVSGGFWGVCFENFIVDASIFVDFVVVFWQATKCDRWMPWHQEPMKDVVTCDKPRGVGKRAVILGCPNGETLNFRSCVR